MKKLIDKALDADRESKYIEFKSEFDPAVARDWCEIIKDIVAIANSGDGIIVFGLTSDGRLTGYDAGKINKVDTAEFTNKIEKYVGRQYSSFEIQEHTKNGKQDRAKLRTSIEYSKNCGCPRTTK